MKKDRITNREKEIKDRNKKDGINSKMKTEQGQTEHLFFFL